MSHYKKMSLLISYELTSKAYVVVNHSLLEALEILPEPEFGGSELLPKLQVERFKMSERFAPFKRQPKCGRCSVHGATVVLKGTFSILYSQ